MSLYLSSYVIEPFSDIYYLHYQMTSESTILINTSFTLVVACY